jgi:hypothetical protein
MLWDTIIFYENQIGDIFLKIAYFIFLRIRCHVGPIRKKIKFKFKAAFSDTKFHRYPLSGLENGPKMYNSMGGTTLPSLHYLMPKTHTLEI